MISTMFGGLRSLLGLTTTDENEPTTTDNDGQEREIKQLTLSRANLCTKDTNELESIEKDGNGNNRVNLDTSSGSGSGRSLKSSISNSSLQISADASRFLNAATTKFTEQLIVPPRPTIEQLQASSHQMLPDLGEMEESTSKLANPSLVTSEIAKKSSTKTNNMISLEKTTQNDDHDNDNCSIDDSWELLDMDGDQKCTKEAKAKYIADAMDNKKENKKNNNNIHIDGDDVIILDKNETVQVEGKNCGKFPLPLKGNTMDSFVITGYGDGKQVNDDDKLIDLIDGKVISLDANSIDDGDPTPESGDCISSPLRANKVGKKNQRKKKKKNKANAKINLRDLVTTSDVSSGSDENQEKLIVDNMTISVMSETNSVFLEPDWNLPKLHDWSIATTSSTKSKPIDPKVSVGCGAAKTKKNLNQCKSKPKDGAKEIVPETNVSRASICSYGEKNAQVKHKLELKKLQRQVELISPDEIREYLQIEETNSQVKLSIAKVNKKTSPKHKDVQVTSVKKCDTPTMEQCNSSSDQQEVDSPNDWAVMDESWYVTPPPCFTGSKTKTSPLSLAKPNARENDLIEHPSIYMSQTASSSASLSNVGAKKSASNNSKKHNNNCFLWVERKSFFAPVPKNLEEQNGIISPQGSILDVDDPSEPLLDRFKVTSKNQKKPTNKRRKGRKEAKRVASENTSSSSGDDKDIIVSKMLKSYHSPKMIVCEPNTDDLLDDDVFGDSENEELGEEAISMNPSESSQISLELNDMDVYISSPETSSPALVDECETVVVKREPYIASPIEPERVPGWQLRRQRMYRKKINKRQAKKRGTATDRNVTRAEEQIEKFKLAKQGQTSPMTMINRLGSSLFANLTNLTSDLRTAVASATVHSPTSPADQQSLPGRTQVSEILGVNEKLVAIQRKAETKRQVANNGRNQLNRQNECAKKGSNKCPGRKTKMAQTQNGVSMNRKVQTNFH